MCRVALVGYAKEKHTPCPVQHGAKSFSGSCALICGPFEFNGLKLAVPD